MRRKLRTRLGRALYNLRKLYAARHRLQPLLAT
jgi:hypothetical protein